MADGMRSSGGIVQHSWTGVGAGLCPRRLIMLSIFLEAPPLLRVAKDNSGSQLAAAPLAGAMLGEVDVEVLVRNREVPSDWSLYCFRG